MDLAFYLAVILIGIIILAIVWFVLKNIVKLIINSILGLVILLVFNYFHIMSLLGKPDITINWLSVLICALGGIPGALLIIILHLAGFAL